MTILYIPHVRMLTEKAHGAQIMKACEAFVRGGAQLELLVPTRHSPITKDPFTYYGLKVSFPLRKLFTPDTVGWGWFGFLFQSMWFGVIAGFAARRVTADFIYGRDEIVLVVAGLLAGKKIFWESHDGAWNFWARRLVKQAAGIVVVTPGAADFYAAHGVSLGRLLVVSNGVDLADFAHPESKETARARLGLLQEAKIALYIGRLDGWKGVTTFLEASKLLPKSALAVIIGGESQQIALLSREYPNVRFLGFRPYTELSNNQAAADVLVVPNTGKDPVSVVFTSPLKLIAHLASGRPIVASDLPTTRFIAEGAALFVQPDDPQALATGITTVLADASLAARLTANAKQKTTGFAWERRAERVLDFLASH